MKLKKLLNEVEAEIVRDGAQIGIPRHKIFSQNGKTVDISNSEWKNIFIDILRAIKEQGLENEFSKDADPLDIVPGKAHGTVLVTADTGKKFVFNINTKKLTLAQ